MPQLKAPSKNMTYEYVRIIGTFLVVMVHSNYLVSACALGSVDYTGEVSSFLTSSFLYKVNSELVRAILWFIMPLFFMLSGAVFAIKPIPKIKDLAANKAKRLLIPYVLYGILFMFPLKYLGGFYTLENLPKAMLSYFYTMDDSGHLWYLPTLFLCFLFLAVLKKLLSKIGCDNSFIILLVAFALSFLSTVIKTNFLAINDFCNRFLWFYIGYLFEKSRKEVSLRQSVVLSVLFSVVSVVSVVAIVKYDFAMTSSIRILLLCATTYFICDLLRRLLKGFSNTKAFAVITRNLFAVYLLHDPMEYIILKVFFSNNLVTSTPAIVLYFVFRIIVVIILSMLISEGIRAIKTTVQKKFKKA